LGEILVGTSGFSYDDWKDIFYPAGLPKNDFLRFYAERFPALELNFSYYRLPEARYSDRMVTKSGDTLVFIIKAFRHMTHDKTENALREIVPLFLEGIGPFIEAERLGGILLQFPQGFHYNSENRIYLKSLIDALLPCPLFVEFRRRDWLKESVFQTLRELGVGFVCVDEPDLPSLLPPLDTITGDSGYVRFHGRNAKNWYGTDATTRYDYLYTEEELGEWVLRINGMADKAKKVYAFFNNHARAQAITNARMLINLIR
jgi:uncharacterized protein YecE (DUF72 family)